ncbi:MAG: hypothetical protein KGP10_03485 [Actinomycetales bacterium]|nr:hypothetical protein [Actinomycetales bacterium]
MRPGSPTPAGGRPPLQQILAGILSDLAILIRAEITLIQARLVSAAVRSAVSGLLIGLAVVLLSSAGLMGLFASAYGLISAGVPAAAAFAIVAGALTLLAILLITAAILLIAIPARRRDRAAAEEMSEPTARRLQGRALTVVTILITPYVVMRVLDRSFSGLPTGDQASAASAGTGVNGPTASRIGDRP